MRLCAIFLILNIHLSHIFAAPPNPLELSSQPNHNLLGYECGNNFFTYNEVKGALSLALDYIGKGYHNPQRYIGKLYSESKDEEYFLYPIQNGPPIMPHIKRIDTVFYIVLTRDSIEEVDVVAKITTGDYTRCLRRYSTHIGPLNLVPEISNGYLCGDEFFTDDIIHQSHALAQTKVKGNPKYPSPYVGLLYPENSGHLMWPIMRENKLYKSGTANIRPYFLILNNERQFVDVVIRGYNNNFLRCIRSRKSQEAPESDPYSDMWRPPTKSGFICGKVFFDEKVIKKNVETAKSQVDEGIKGRYPTEYFGPPFNQQCLMWPISQDGSLFKMGSKGSYRLILTPDYKVMSVAMFVQGRLKVCERKTIIAIKNHDTSDYHCNDRSFSHQQLVAAADIACAKMETVTRNFYPARYEGPRFDLDGPYFTYPVFGDNVKNFKFRAGLYRVVINMNCEVVGALTTLHTIIYELNKKVLKKLVKCHRLANGPIPPGFFGANAEAVLEIKARN